MQSPAFRHYRARARRIAARICPYLLGLGLAAVLGGGFVYGSRQAIPWGSLVAWSALFVVAIDPWGTLGRSGILGGNLNRRLRRMPSPPPVLVALAVLAASSFGFYHGHATVALGLVAALSGAGFRRHLFHAQTISRSGWEPLRWILVFGAVAFVIRPYLHPGLVGGGDAQHYAQQLADALIQIRHGEFPLYVGQSIYAYNGDIHPLRTAPYFQYVGVALNVLTGETLGPPGVQNLFLVLSLFAAGWIMYSVALRLGGRNAAWAACFVAIAFVTSPGVLALIYSGDMVLSWLTLPYLPLLIFSLVRVQEVGDPTRPLAILGITLALLWWVHAPIAFWLCPLAGLCVANRIWRERRQANVWWVAAGILGLSALLSSYVFVGVATLDIPEDYNLVRFVRSGGVLQALRMGWAGTMRPVEPTGSDLLHNLQLSPILWLGAAVALATIGYRWRSRATFWCYVFALVLLLVPSPIADKLWRSVPAAIIGATEKWPMQRFYPILSALVPFLIIFALQHPWFRRKGRRLALTGALVVGCVYSCVEATKFIRRGLAIANAPAFSAQRFREENAVLSRYSYEYYGRLPRYFSSGPMAPSFQNRLLALDSLEPLDSNAHALQHSNNPPVPPELYRFVATDFGARLEQKLKLSPHESYLFTFNLGPSAQGVLELIGKTVYRQYPVGTGTELRAFNDFAGDAMGFGIWTSGDVIEEVETRFYATPGTAAIPADARAQAFKVKEADLPFQLTRLIPYSLATRSDKTGWLETPKIFVPGYVALLDGNPVPVERSPDGLVMARITSGAHRFELEYHGPWTLRAAFWLAALSWIAVVTMVFITPGYLRRRPFLLSSTLVRLGQGTAVAALLLMIVLPARAYLTRPENARALGLENSVSMRLSFPVGKKGACETLVSKSQSGHVFTCYVWYVNGQNVRIGISRDGVPVTVSGLVPTNYLLDHELQLDWALDSAGSASEHVANVVIDHRLVIGAAKDGGVGPNSVPTEAPPASTPFSGRIVSAYKNSQ